MRLLLALVLLAACGPKLQPMPSIHERCQAAPRPELCEVIGQQVDAEQAAAAPAYQPTDGGHVVIPPHGQPWVWVPPGGHVVIPPGRYGRGQWVGVGP